MLGVENSAGYLVELMLLLNLLNRRAFTQKLNSMIVYAMRRDLTWQSWPFSRTLISTPPSVGSRQLDGGSLQIASVHTHT